MKKTHYPDLAETLYRTRLPNGLSVIVLPKAGFSKKMAYFVTDFGSIHTEFSLEGEHYTVPAGIAHYLEHKMFDLPDGRDVSAEFAAMGASTNAFTSYDLTAYYFSTTENFENCLKLLLEFVSTPYFTQESVEKERGIIDQEIDMNLDNPDSMIFEDLVQSMYAAHPIRVPILGDHASIREITPETLYLCHRAFYTPANMLLCVVGDVDPEAVCRIAENQLGIDKHPAARKISHWPEEMQTPRKEFSREMEVAMPMFQLGFKCEAQGKGDAAIREEMLADLAAEALFGESSALYLRLYEAGIIDSSFGGGYETVDGCALLLCAGDSRDPAAVEAAILEEAQHLCRSGIPAENFLRMKRSALGRRIRALDSFDASCFRLCAYHFSDFDYFRFPEIYQGIQAQELLDFLARVITPERASLCIVNPNSKEASL